MIRPPDATLSEIAIHQIVLASLPRFDLTALPATSSCAPEPSSYREAVQIPEWQAAMSDELAALERTSTWDLAPLSPGAIPITCKWVYKVKTRSDGSVERYKARLVARGFKQEHGRDYDETFEIGRAHV